MTFATSQIATDFAAGPLTEWGEEVVYTPDPAVGGATTTFYAIVTDLGGTLAPSATGIDATNNFQIQFLAADETDYASLGSLDPDTIDPRGTFKRSSDSAILRPAQAPANHYGVVYLRAERRNRKKFGKG